MNANNESFLNLPTLFVDMLNFVGNSTIVLLSVIRATRFPTTHTDSTYSYTRTWYMVYDMSDRY